jgi:protein-tyrosine phosphatase
LYFLFTCCIFYLPVANTCVAGTLQFKIFFKRRSMALIDIHSHILPGIDDGAADTGQALAFAREAEKQGVAAIFATPHCCDGVYDCDRDTILAAAWRMSATVREAGLKIRILPGAEVRITHDLLDRFDAGCLLTLGNGGAFLLLELPPMFIVPAVLRIIRQLTERGVTPLIAHAERNPMIINQPELAPDLMAAGARLQVTAASLTGDFGRTVFKAAKQLVETGRVFCLGSDIHPDRKYRMKAAAKKIEKWVGRQQAVQLLLNNPEQILQLPGNVRWPEDFTERSRFLKTGDR